MKYLITLAALICGLQFSNAQSTSFSLRITPQGKAATYAPDSTTLAWVDSLQGRLEDLFTQFAEQVDVIESFVEKQKSLASQLTPEEEALLGTDGNEILVAFLHTRNTLNFYRERYPGTDIDHTISAQMARLDLRLESIGQRFICAKCAYAETQMPGSTAGNRHCVRYCGVPEAKPGNHFPDKTEFQESSPTHTVGDLFKTTWLTPN